MALLGIFPSCMCCTEYLEDVYKLKTTLSPSGKYVLAGSVLEMIDFPSTSFEEDVRSLT